MTESMHFYSVVRLRVPKESKSSSLESRIDGTHALVYRRNVSIRGTASRLSVRGFHLNKVW
jgi:hypothetical protein